MKERLLTLLEAAIEAAHPAHCLPAHLPPPPAGGRLYVLAVGKAAAAMGRVAEAHYGAMAGGGAMAGAGAKAGRARLMGLATVHHLTGAPPQHLALIEAGHPIPDAQSQRAAERALALAHEAGPEDLVLVLLSGGASALWAAPAPGLTLADKQALTRSLLAAGAPIAEINAVRKHLSRIKGGRLAAAAAPARVVTLAISDVPGDDPAAIGSGPTVPDPTTLAAARHILARYAIAPSPTIERALGERANETPKPDDPLFADNAYTLVATPQMALAAAARRARALGYEVQLLGDALEGEARDLARVHAERALAAFRRGERVALLSGGEVTVTLRGNGRGGPNQEYALALAIALAGAPGIVALAADTDGCDGGTGARDDPAGACVFPDTLTRAERLGLDAATFLRNNDSGRFFAPLGDLVVTGPSETNVNDFRVILVDPGGQADARAGA